VRSEETEEVVPPEDVTGVIDVSFSLSVPDVMSDKDGRETLAGTDGLIAFVRCIVFC